MNPLRFPFRALRLIGPADERESASRAPKPLRRARHLRSLEQRFMFDGAAVADAAHAVAMHDVAVPAPVEVRAADPVKDSGKKEVVFVDTSVSNYKTLEAGIPQGMGIVEIDGSQNGLAQIASWAQTHSGFDAIHILSHGTEGMLEIGTAFVNETALQSSATQSELADIGHALKSGGDLLLYGCNVAAGTDGQHFVNDLAAAAGADVAASIDNTGAAAKGGNWTLEAQVGHIDVAALDISGYTDVLGNVITGNDPGAACTDVNTVSTTSGLFDIGQSFTATKTGLLTTLTLYASFSNGGTATLNIYSGDGTGGTLLESQTLSPFNDAGTLDSGNNRYIATDITLSAPVNITNGNVYTFQITTTDYISLTYTNQTNYAGGTLYQDGSDAGSSYDLEFAVTQADANAAPSNTVAPAVSGTQTVGNALSATTGTWSDPDNDALTYSYQWYRADDNSGTNAVAIGGATSSSYTLTTADAHEYLRVVVTADDGNSHTPTANSSWTAVNDSAPVNSVAPVLSGTATVGNALSATTGTWSDADNDALTYSYQWYRADDNSGTNAAAISGATASSYTLGSSDGNEYVRVVVTANDSHGSSNQTAASSWTSVATVPSVSSIVRSGGASSTVSTAASSISYTVTFSESVTGVDASDFSLTDTGTASGSIASVVGSGTTYTVIVDTLSGDGTTRLDLNGSGTGIQNGSHVDIAGGYTAGSTYTLDHTAPNAPTAPDMTSGTDTGSSNSDDITGNTTPTFAGTAESGSTVTLYDTDGTTVLGTTTATGGNWSITSSSLSEGSHTLTAKATDSAGNVSTASSGLAVTIDTSAPTGLGLSATTIATSNASSASTIATLSATDGQAITYSLATGNGTNDADNGSFTISGTSLEVGGSSLAAGTYKIYVAATDAAGNVADQAFTITVADAPSVSSIVRTGGASSTVDTSATSVQYTVTFSESVTGVDASDFALTSTGTAAGSIASISGSGTTYTVTVDTLSGDGTMRLDLNSSGTGIQNGSSIDIAGGYTSGSTYTLDHTAPNAPTAPDMTSGTDTGSSNSDDITSNTTPTFTGTAESGSTVTLYDTDGTTVLGTTTATGGNWSITSSSLSEGSHTLTAKATDSAGNVSAASSGLAVTIDSTAPTVASVSVPANGAYKAGDNLDFTVSLSEAVTVDTSGGTPRVALTVGSSTVYADYVSGSGSSTLVFRYTVQAGDNDTNGIAVGALQSNGGTLRDTAGNDMTLTLNSVGSTASVLVDTTAPTVTDGNISLSGASGTGGAYKIGDTVTATWNNTAGGDNNGDILDVTVDFSAFGGGSAVTATNSAGTWTATYTITAGAIDGVANRNIAVTATDNAGNVSTASDTTNATVDSVAPTVTLSGIALSNDTGSSSTDFLTRSASQTITATMSGPLAAGDLVYGSLDNGATWTDITGKVSGTSLSWNGVTLGASSTLQIKVTDAAGNDGAVASQAYTLDTSAPGAPSAPLMSSSSDTGSSSSDRITSDTTPTFSGTAEAGSIVTLYDSDGSTVLGSTVASGGAWSITSSALSDGNHTVTATATDAAGNVSAACTGTAVTIDTGAPVVGSVSGPADGSYKAGDTLSFTVNTNEAVTVDTTGGSPRLAVVIGNATVYAAYASGSGSGALVFHYIVQPGDIDSDGITVSALQANGAGLRDSAGNAMDLTLHGVAGTGGVRVDTAAPAITSVSASTADGAYKAGDTINITVDFDTAVSVDTAGGRPTLALNSGGIASYISGSGSSTLVFAYTVGNGQNTADLDVTGTAALSLNGATIAASSGSHLDAALTLAAPGAAGSLGASKAIEVDTIAPSTTLDHLALSADTGTSPSDFVTRSASQTISATLSAPLAAGDKVYGSLDNGATWTDITSQVSGTSLTWAGVTLSGSSTLQLKVTDHAGNDGAVASRAYTLDTTAPAAPAVDALSTTGTAPVLTGIASLAAGETLKVAVAGASYSVTPGSDGHWQLDLSSATPDSGTLALASGSSYVVTATVTDTAGNTCTTTASLDLVAPPAPAPAPVRAPAPVTQAVTAPAAPAIETIAPPSAAISFLSPTTESVLATTPLGSTLAATLSPVSAAAAVFAPVTPELPSPIAPSPAPFTLTRGDGSGFPVMVVSPDSGAPSADALMLNHGMGDQTVQTSGASEISVPADTFAHTDPNALIQLSAVQANGQPLPSWVAFDAHRGKFEVRAPQGVSGDLVIKLVARDAQGHQAVTTFKLHVGNARAALHSMATPSGRPGLSEQVRTAAQGHAARLAALERLHSHHEAQEAPWQNA